MQKAPQKCLRHASQRGLAGSVRKVRGRYGGRLCGILSGSARRVFFWRGWGDGGYAEVGFSDLLYTPPQSPMKTKSLLLIPQHFHDAFRDAMCKNYRQSFAQPSPKLLGKPFASLSHAFCKTSSNHSAPSSPPPPPAQCCPQSPVRSLPQSLRRNALRRIHAGTQGAAHQRRMVWRT